MWHQKHKKRKSRSLWTCSCEYINSTYNYNQMRFQRNFTGKSKGQRLKSRWILQSFYLKSQLIWSTQAWMWDLPNWGYNRQETCHTSHAWVHASLQCFHRKWHTQPETAHETMQWDKKHLSAHWIGSRTGRDAGSEQQEAWRWNGNTFHDSERKQDKHLRLIMCTMFVLAASLLAKNILFFLSVFLLPATPLFLFHSLTHTQYQRKNAGSFFIHIASSRLLKFKSVICLRGQEMCHCLRLGLFLCLFTATEVTPRLHVSYWWHKRINDAAKFLKQTKLKTALTSWPPHQFPF